MNEINANPNIASTNAITTKIITARIEIARAFSHPQSKKRLTSASQIINWIMEAMKPLKSDPKNAPMTVPRITIHMASVNFALSFPESALPESHNTGDSIMTLIITWMTNKSKFRANPFANSQVAACWQYKSILCQITPNDELKGKALSNIYRTGRGFYKYGEETLKRGLFRKKLRQFYLRSEKKRKRVRERGMMSGPLIAGR